ncbi:MAG: leucine-rich repeat domain-containing protein [Clostridia bacterium]|nr:leucine-rich repeat domain-containing protein [Clostridia bacterium]
MKKILTALFISTILVTMCILSVSAAESGTCGKDLTWTLEDGTLTISGTGDMDDYDAVSAVTIGNDGRFVITNDRNADHAPWYSDRFDIQKIVVSKGVISIGSAAFFDCTKVVDVQLPEGLLLLGDNAFKNCRMLTEICFPESLTTLGATCFEDSGLAKAEISENISKIGCGAFCSTPLTEFVIAVENKYFSTTDGLLLSADKTKLYCYPSARTDTNYTVPAYITHIMARAFSQCENLRTVTLHDGVKGIEDNAFNPCKKLESIYIPASVQTLGTDVFKTDVELTIYGEDRSKARSYANVNGIRFSSGPMPTNVFDWSVDDAGVLTISGTGYISQESLESAPWKEKEHEIRTLVIDEGVIGITEYVFDGVSNVESLVLPSTLQKISGGPFQNCSELLDISFSARNNYFCVEDGVLFNKRKTGLYLYPAQRSGDSYTVPSGVLEIFDYAFCSAKLQAIYISSSVNSIYQSAFTNCDWLSIVSFASGCKYVQLDTLKGLNVRAIYIPDAISSLMVYGYNDPNVVIYGDKPDDSRKLYTLQNGELVPTVYKSFAEKQAERMGVPFVTDPLPKLSTFWTLEDGVLTISGIGKMPDYEKNGAPWESKKDKIHTVIIEEGITKVGDYAFYQCKSLKEVELPNTLIGIGDAAFGECTALESVTIPKKVQEMGFFPFYGCSALTALKVEDGNLHFRAKNGVLYDHAETELIGDPADAYRLRDVLLMLKSKQDMAKQDAVSLLLKTLVAE